MTETNFLTDFQKILRYQYHKNPFTGSQVVPCRQTDGQMARHYITKLMLAFRNFSNMSKTK